MSKPVTSDIKYYNANSKNNNTGDCVVRSIALAYNKDYDEVLHELNAFKRKLGYTRYNQSSVFDPYIKSLGLAVSDYVRPDYFGLSDNVTELEFSEKVKSGIYLLISGKSAGSVSHMVVCINGTLYDSWHSGNQVVSRIYIVQSDEAEIDDAGNIDDYSDVIEDFALDYLNKIQKKKSPYFEFKLWDKAIARLDDYTVRLGFEIHVIDDEINDLFSEQLRGHEDDVFAAKWFVAKINPNLSYEYNLERSENKLRDQLREWVWSVRSVIEKSVSIKTMHTHPKYRGSRSELLKLPEKFRPYIILFDDRGSNEWTDRYYIEMEAFPDDPRKANDPVVYLYGESIKEIKYQLNEYAKDYSRYMFDY